MMPDNWKLRLTDPRVFEDRARSLSTADHPTVSPSVSIFESTTDPPIEAKFGRHMCLSKCVRPLSSWPVCHPRSLALGRTGSHMPQEVEGVPG